MSGEAGATELRIRSLPPDRPLGHLAEELLGAVGRLPELARHTVVVPHPALIPHLAAALRVQAGQPCPLPRILTLDDWLAQQPVPPAAVSRLRLVAELQRHLGSQRWLSAVDRWQLADELTLVFDEWLEQHTRLAVDLGALTEQVARAATGLRDRGLQFESHLANELCLATHGRSDAGLTDGQRRALAMAHLAAHLAGPVWVLDAGRVSARERDFWLACAVRQTVTLLHLDASLCSRSAWVAAAGVQDARPLRERAAGWMAAHPQAPTGISVFSASGREAEALHVCNTVCEWLADGVGRIAVVASDRALARRLRALLERRAVLLNDAAGWTLATTRVGAALRDWLAMAWQPTAGLLANCLDSPLLAPRLDVSTAAAFNAALARQAPHARLDWTALNRSLADAPLALAMLGELQQSTRGVRGAARPLGDWVAAMHQALCSLAPSLADDPAGAQLLQALDDARLRLRADASPRPADELVDWLDWWLSTTHYRETGVSSPVTLTYPGATRGMTFDAIAVCGADATHIPAPVSSRRLLRDAARAQLDLQTAEAAREQSFDDWCLLIGSAPRVLISWQGTNDRGEPNPPSPWLALMDGFHRLAWGCALPLAQAFSDAVVAPPDALPPPTSGRLKRLPERLSASAYQSLLACPFQYLVRDGLGLRLMEEVTEDVDKRDYGVVVHAILRQFHAAVPVVAALGGDAARAELTTISQAEFAPLVRKDYAARAWQLRWEAVIPGYIEWQMSREAAGWRVRVEDCEQAVTSALAVPAHGEIALFGTPDRVDEALEGEVPRRAVLDYKTSGRDRLKGLERRPDEDGQLVLYAHLFSDVGELAYVPLEGGRDNRAVQPVALAGDVLVAVVDQHIDRLQQTLSRIGNGEALVAMGDEAACRYCQARGLCRRDHRATFTPQPASAA